jgi:hypothetical protein
VARRDLAGFVNLHSFIRSFVQRFSVAFVPGLYGMAIDFDTSNFAISIYFFLYRARSVTNVEDQLDPPNRLRSVTHEAYRIVCNKLPDRS